MKKTPLAKKRSSGKVQHFVVWFVPIKGKHISELSGIQASEDLWSAPCKAKPGHLVLYYATAPESCIRDIFVIASPVEYVEAVWKPGFDYMAAIKRVCTLNSPLQLPDLRDHGVRGNMQGRNRASKYWPALYRLIVERNPGVEAKLRRFVPKRIL